MFLPFNEKPVVKRKENEKEVNYFNLDDENIDHKTVESFGDEWEKFDYFSQKEIDDIAQKHYFDIVPDLYLKDKRILDMGCGTGRWSKYVAKLAQTVDAVDPSKAILVASKLLKDHPNIRLSRASVNQLPFANASFDFIFSLGVLHHIPDTALAMQKCTEKLKPGGYFLLYLYYSLDNRSSVFKFVFKISNVLRAFISSRSQKAKALWCDVIAVLVYLPLVGLGKLMKGIGFKRLATKMPLHFYIDKSFNVIRNDALDRFGTPLEQRFSKLEIQQMMENAGLTEIVFSNNEPYWHAIGKKK